MQHLTVCLLWIPSLSDQQHIKSDCLEYTISQDFRRVAFCWLVERCGACMRYGRHVRGRLHASCWVEESTNRKGNDGRAYGGKHEHGISLRHSRREPVPS